MARFLFVAREAGTAALILIPLFCILHCIRFRNLKTTCAYTLFAVYLAGIYAVVGLPTAAYIRLEPNLNLIPFIGMLISPENTILNVLLFLPLGLFLPLLWKPFRHPGRCVVFGTMLSLTIELLQIFTFRATDIDDVITNALGTLIGWFFMSVLFKVRPALRCSNRTSDLVIILGSVCFVMFFLHPYMSTFLLNHI